MENYYKAIIKVSFEDKKGNLKYKKEPYLVKGISPTDVETKIAKYIEMLDYELVSVVQTSIVDVIE